MRDAGLRQLRAKAGLRRLREDGGPPLWGALRGRGAGQAGRVAGLARERAALLEEINALGLEGLHAEELYLLNGFRINLEYELADGGGRSCWRTMRCTGEPRICRPGGQRYYGVASDGEHLLVSEYGPAGSAPASCCGGRGPGRARRPRNGPC